MCFSKKEECINFIKITNRKGLISSSLFFVPIIKISFYFFSDVNFVWFVCFFLLLTIFFSAQRARPRISIPPLNLKGWTSGECNENYVQRFFYRILNIIKMMFKGLLKLKFVDLHIYEHNKNDVHKYNL